ncbi:MAG: M15 family metallopeptidase [Phascolarctobacterium sp.]|nr:M15 family metallopeptidase [Phascolarctobacterium sp.]
MNLKTLTAGFLTGLCLFIKLDAFASQNLPKDAPKDIKHVLGFYFGNGENILIRENHGNLELLYRTKYEDNCFKEANVFPLTKEFFDSYTLLENGPLRIQEGTVKFQRDKDGYGISLRVGGNNYTRRFLGAGVGEKPSNFAIKSHTEEEWAAMRKTALESPMPEALKLGEETELVPASSVAGLKENNIYATSDNLFQAPLYDTQAMYVGKETAQALTKVNERLKAYGVGLVLWDAYRPWHISKLANLALPENGKSMLPDPDKEGSSHNTGNAVDVGLYDLETGEELEMISGFDEPSVRQYASYPGGTTRQRFLKELLHQEMELAGFQSIEMEWWHYEFGGNRKFAKLNMKVGN